MNQNISQEVDKIIERINSFKVEPIFSIELESRNKRKVADALTDNEIIEVFTNLIAYSQNANSELVEQVIMSGIFKEIFSDFNIDEIVKMNPCDLADEYWHRISGIRQQAKLFHIVSLARKIKNIGSFSKLLEEIEIPKEIITEADIDLFWKGFGKLRKKMNKNKVPFFRSTTSLLHFLLETGYDCAKPDLVVMKVAKKIGIVDQETGESNLIKAVRAIQEYSICKGIRPSVVDFYFLIDEGQLGAKKYVNNEFYKSHE